MSIPTTSPPVAGRPAENPLQRLKVIDRLEVGPVQLEPQRLIAPYRVIQGKREAQTELVYRYEEPVFDPGEPESHNLAAMMAAQVALNYGLFCDSIVFYGPYDKTDRRFLTDMAENTAVEIYVKKFLQPNPFLIGEAAKLPVLHRKKYLQAQLVFRSTDPPATAPWQTDPQRHALLSSGGKDSLLSYGLLNELGVETHPIFGNESGRHWFTALNAYRYFREHIPHTARVWMNSDRLFAWMLRHFPFIRRDFATVRSDEYPLRLWTVAVFLFGVLPLARKRGLGRVLIGDEYDTTWRTVFQGISHYDGLFDQSRYFDDALTDYYREKGWNLTQFSILRPLSEMLILKILVNRYPDLQAHQVSCHAAHMEGGRVHPCGKCEKCRRIVGMLKAFEADPTRCGYTPAQIERILKEIPRLGLHQESAGIHQLLRMLAKKKLVELPESLKETLTLHPEILKLRFHPERSPLDSIPADLRKPLYTLLLKQAEQAVRYNGQNWVSFDPLTHPAIHQS